MIFHVESYNEGCPAYTWHISSNIKLAYSVLTDPKSIDSCRSMTVISENGKEITTFYDSWDKKAPSIEEIMDQLEPKGIYKVKVDFAGYIRGYCIHEVEANSEKEALANAPRYIDEQSINIVRNDLEIIGESIY